MEIGGRQHWPKEANGKTEFNGISGWSRPESGWNSVVAFSG
jgi:hypothetical protein